MNRGYNKWYRKRIEHPLYNKGKWDYWHMWDYLIAMAAWKTEEVILRGRVYILKPGQLIIQQVHLAKKAGWSKNKITRYLTNLQTMQQIDYQIDNVTTLVTIKNWHKYAGSELANELTNGLPCETPNELADDGHIIREEIKEIKKTDNVRAGAPAHTHASNIAIPNKDDDRVWLYKNEKGAILVSITREQYNKIPSWPGCSEEFREYIIKHFRDKYATLWKRDQYKDVFKAMRTHWDNRFYPFQQNKDTLNHLRQQHTVQRETQAIQEKKETSEDMRRKMAERTPEEIQLAKEALEQIKASLAGAFSMPPGRTGRTQSEKQDKTGG